MKKEKRLKELEVKIEESSLRDKKSDLISLRELIKKETKGQTEAVTNFKHLLDLIEKKEREEYYLSIEEKSKLGFLVDEQAYLTNLIVKSSFSLEIKEMAYGLKREMEDYLSCPSILHYDYLGEESRVELSRLRKEKEDKNQAQAVMAMIDEIPQLLTLSDEAYVEEVNLAYEALNPEAKSFVLNYQRLLDANKTLEDMHKALAVDDAILGLKTNFTLDDKEDILDCYQRYLDLTENQKAYLLNKDLLLSLMDDLERLEAETKDHHQALLFDKQIDITYDCVFDSEIDDDIKKNSYDTLVSMYNLLSEKQKAYLENLDCYDEIEIKMADIIKNIDNRKLANELYDEINCLPVYVDKLDLAVIEEMINRYQNLEFKELVTNSDVLFKNEKIIKQINNAMMVDGIINSITDFKDIDEITKAREKYDLLDAEEKPFVMSYSKLKSMEIEGKKYQDAMLKARNINSRIVSLKINESLAILMELNSEYEALGNNKELVDKYYLLEEAITRAYQIQDGLKIMERIDKLPTNVSLEYLSLVEDIYYDYDLLSEFGKEAVLNIKSLDGYMDELNERMDEVELLKSKIKEIDIAELHEGNDIADARTMYELLDSDQQVLVSNYQSLLEAEKEFLRISSLRENVSLVKSYLDEQIINLSELVNDPYIDEVKKKEYYVLVYGMYQSLTEEQRSLVKRYDELVNIGRQIK